MPQNLASKKQGFMSRYVNATQALIDARNSLIALKSEWDANGYSVAIVQADIDGSGGNLVHLTPAVMASGFNSQIALEALLNNLVPTQGNHITNLNAVRG